MVKATFSSSILMVLLLTQSRLVAQDLPDMPGPEAEHEWLRALAGEWQADGEVYIGADKPPLKTEGTENARMIGEFWLLAEGRGSFMGTPITSMLTLGYDPEKKKYIGTWIDSMTGYLWAYEGTVDKAGTTLTLETQGPCPKRPGELAKIKERIELKNKNHKVFTSSMQEVDGSWTKLVSVHYRRK